jgi:16S rRNA A1518/A1519 N6-dimethyltransferase RsmA/KsgA/DIM1 with predicted DNA glycosylase/AP lyase activity
MSSGAYFPTHPEIIREMLELAQVGSDDVVMDLGCGDGRILIVAVQDFGAKSAVGYELETHIVTLAAHNIRSQNLQDRITVIRDDLFNANLAEADVIAVYLTTMALERLPFKLRHETKKGTRIVSNGHQIPTWAVTKSTFVGPFQRIFLYRTPEAFTHSPRRSSRMKKLKQVFSTINKTEALDKGNENGI